MLRPAFGRADGFVNFRSVEFLLKFYKYSDNLFARQCFLSFSFFDTVMDYRIEKLLTKIHADITLTPNTKQLAESFGVSVSYLQYLFKRDVGQSLAKYIKDLRLQKTRELLETTHLSVKEIRLKIGWKRKAHFFRDFKRKFGSTPIEYRKNYRK